CIFFFSVCGDRRLLHSFPTRRSSDLGQPVASAGRLPRVTQMLALALCFQDMVKRGDAKDYADLAAARRRDKGADEPDHEAKRERSEEHTSELQSRFDLVCRLLLEKKK